MKRKGIISAIALTCVCVLAGGFMVGCSSDGRAAYKFNSNQELYAFSAVSGIELALSQDAGAGVQSLSLEENEFENMVDSIHSYLPVFEGFMGGEKLISPKKETSDNEAYKNMLSTKFTDALGNNHNYEIYYNETKVIENTGDREIKSNISGEIYMNDIRYPFTGVKEIEHDETEIEFIVEIDATSYVVINQELENDEQEFAYTYFDNGNEVYSISVGFEIENGRVEYSTEYENEVDGTEMELEIYQSKKNNNIFYVEYENEDDKEVKIKIQKVTESGSVKYVYTYGDLEVTKTVA